ncbi:MAG: CehA/McbA family metallohydrolase [Armatimonadetes bacterium]|nr:CehA/McbA family metallohydrolase [Armatimonadota bacterium]
MTRRTIVAVIAVGLLGRITPGPAWADGEGSATIAPDTPAVAGTRDTWTITYRPGPEGIQPGGGLRLALSGFPIRLFALPQTDRPTDPNYTTAHCSNPVVPITVRVVRDLRQGWQDVQELEVLVGEPGLAPVDSLSIVYGDRSQGGPGGQMRPHEGDELPVRMYSDTDGDGKFAPLAEFPRLTLAGGTATRIAVFAPSDAVVGAPVRIAVSARDDRDQLATSGPREVLLTGAGLQEPVSIRFPEGERCVAPAEVVFASEGIHKITASAGIGTATAPTVVTEFSAQTRPDAEADPEFIPALQSVEVSAVKAAPGSVLAIRPVWRNAGTAAASRDYRISCHLERRPPQGRALANWDYDPAPPTTQWHPGGDYTQERLCPIPRDIPPGEHALTLGMYHSPEPGKFVVLASFEVCRIMVGPDMPLVLRMHPGESNPVRVRAKAPRWRLLWGDTHCHTENSVDGSGSVQGLYWYARDVARLDFCACADHVGHSYPEDQWRHIQEMARRFYESGRFVSILGYEWSNAEHGDKNVYFVRDDEPIRVPRSGQAEDLFAMLQGVNCIVIPHHPAYPVGLRGTDWGRIDPAFVPVVEMCSAHGNGEVMDNPRPYGANKPMGPSLPGGFAQDALARGLRIGFIASSDDHTAHAGRVGFLAGVYAESLDREGIFEALRSRRCYASTGARILLDVTADGQPMGSEITATAPPLIRVSVHGTADLGAVEIIRDGQVCHRVRPEGPDCETEYRADSLGFRDGYYYARVTQRDGEMAWSSPIFVRNAGPRPELALDNLDIEDDNAVAVTVRNDGAVATSVATIQFFVDHMPSTPVAREAVPVPSGIGGLMSRQAGLQVWRWPVDETSLNVFIRWGGDDESRQCEGEVRLEDGQGWIWTPFHAESSDLYEEPQPGVIRWRTDAEAGTGDGLNLWVKIDPRRPTRLTLDAKRGGARRPAEIYSRLGPTQSLPLAIPLVEYQPDRLIGEATLPELAPGQERRITMPWRPEGAPAGDLICRILAADGKVEAEARLVGAGKRDSSKGIEAQGR